MAANQIAQRLIAAGTSPERAQQFANQYASKFVAGGGKPKDVQDAFDAELDKAYDKADKEFTSLINSIKERAHIEEIIKKIDRMLGKSHTPKELIENYTELKNAFIQAIKEVDIQHKKYSTTITKASADKIHKFAQKDIALGFVRKTKREAKRFFPELNDEKKYLKLKNLLNL